MIIFLVIFIFTFSKSFHPICLPREILIDLLVEDYTFWIIIKNGRKPLWRCQTRGLGRQTQDQPPRKAPVRRRPLNPQTVHQPQVFQTISHMWQLGMWNMRRGGSWGVHNHSAQGSDQTAQLQDRLPEGADRQGYRDWECLHEKTKEHEIPPGKRRVPAGAGGEPQQGHWRDIREEQLKVPERKGSLWTIFQDKGAVLSGRKPLPQLHQRTPRFLPENTWESADECHWDEKIAVQSHEPISHWVSNPQQFAPSEGWTDLVPHGNAGKTQESRENLSGLREQFQSWSFSQALRQHWGYVGFGKHWVWQGYRWIHSLPLEIPRSFWRGGEGLGPEGLYLFLGYEGEVHPSVGQYTHRQKHQFRACFWWRQWHLHLWLVQCQHILKCQLSFHLQPCWGR